VGTQAARRDSHPYDHCAQLKLTVRLAGRRPGNDPLVALWCSEQLLWVSLDAPLLLPSFRFPQQSNGLFLTAAQCASRRASIGRKGR
jgi:hypothetical protein